MIRERQEHGSAGGPATSPGALASARGALACALLLALSLGSLLSGGCSGHSITVPTNQSPTVSATGTPLNGNPPLVVAFNSTASDPDGRVVGYLWDFQDGTTSTEADPVHTFSSIGFYRTTVTVRDEWGASASVEVSVNVSPNARPAVNAGPDQLNRDPGLTITLNGSATDADPGQTLSYQWTQIGGPGVSLGSPNSPSTSFGTPSGTTTTYSFRLTVTDNGSPQLSDFDDVVVSIRVTYVNTTAGIFNTRCDAPGLGSTCHGTDSFRTRLNTYTQVFNNRALIDSKINGGTMSGYVNATERSILHNWILNGAPQTN